MTITLERPAEPVVTTDVRVLQQLPETQTGPHGGDALSADPCNFFTGYCNLWTSYRAAD